MKTKYTMIVFALFVLGQSIFGQIPNGDFENWRAVVNCTEPKGWYSLYSLMDSSGTNCSLTKSTDHYPVAVGNYSAMIQNDTALWNAGNFVGWGILISSKLSDRPLFPVTGHPKALCGYYKFLPQNGDTMDIHFHFYKNGTEITSGEFQSSVTASSWTPFKLFASDTLYSGIDSARIAFSPSTEPKGGSKPHGNSVLYIDNLSFDTLITAPASLAELSREHTLFNLYPNPASGIVSFNIYTTYNENLNINIYNNFGALIITETINRNQPQINISDLNNGIYMISVNSKDRMENKKLIIQKPD